MRSANDPVGYRRGLVLGLTLAETLLLVRELLSYMPQNNMEDSPVVPTTDDPLRADLDDRIVDA